MSEQWQDPLAELVAVPDGFVTFSEVPLAADVYLLPDERESGVPEVEVQARFAAMTASILREQIQERGLSGQAFATSEGREVRVLHAPSPEVETLVRVLYEDSADQVAVRQGVPVEDEAGAVVDGAGRGISVTRVAPEVVEADRNRSTDPAALALYRPYGIGYDVEVRALREVDGDVTTTSWEHADIAAVYRQVAGGEDEEPLAEWVSDHPTREEAVAFAERLPGVGAVHLIAEDEPTVQAADLSPDLVDSIIRTHAGTDGISESEQDAAESALVVAARNAAASARSSAARLSRAAGRLEEAVTSKGETAIQQAMRAYLDGEDRYAERHQQRYE